MKIEYLFGDLCNLYGDFQNVEYLRQSLPEAEIVTTTIHDTPAFVGGDVDMIYMGSMTERTQRKVISLLMPYKARLEELMEKGTVILFTGNAYEVLTKEVDNVTEGIRTEGLGIFDLYTKTDLFNRHNAKVVGWLDDIEVVGYKASFSAVYGDNSGEYFLKCDEGFGSDRKSCLEGVRRKNFFGTHLIGPILPSNPLFTKKLISLICGEERAVAFEKEAMDAYNARLVEYHDKARVNF